MAQQQGYGQAAGRVAQSAANAYYGRHVMNRTQRSSTGGSGATPQQQSPWADTAVAGLNTGFNALMDRYGSRDPKSAGELGSDSKKFMDQAFPGTNPWERLGSQSPAGAVEVQQASGGIQKQVVEKQTRTMRENVGKQVSQQRHQTDVSARVQKRLGDQKARAEGMAIGTQYGDQDYSLMAAQYIQEGDDGFSRLPRGPSAHVRSARAAETSAGASSVSAQASSFTAETGRMAHILQGKRLEFEIAHVMGDPGTSAIAVEALRTYKILKGTPGWAKWIKENPNKLRAIGATKRGMEVLKGIVGFGKIKNVTKRTGQRPTSVAPKKAPPRTYKKPAKVGTYR